ncbi:MAG: type I-F CRISPR-associated protein Csy3 [Opitutae bacterium]|nr:type I-F CRISPR-associated protein Csy3 [Opitutae bacterium]
MTEPERHPELLDAFASAPPGRSRAWAGVWLAAGLLVLAGDWAARFGSFRWQDVWRQPSGPVAAAAVLAASIRTLPAQTGAGLTQMLPFPGLAARYAANIANGRFLWRNRIGLEKIEVRVSHIVNEKVANEWHFDAGRYSLRSFDGNLEDLSALAEVIRKGIAGEGFSFLDIKAFARIGSGQEVFPSQELVLDNSRNNRKSKTLYQVEDVAAIHSQKIGNAL